MKRGRFVAAPMARGQTQLSLVASTPRRCRACGCTDANCARCIQRTGARCFWVAEDLCGACVEPVEQAA